jgi:hydroxymethylpyrimidine/phosphomethylpyrimidine kinase
MLNSPSSGRNTVAGNALTVPAVLVFAGNDPSGGAGIQADIEALGSMGCHTLPVITALTVQDTTGVQEYLPVDATWVISQARAVLEDMRVAAFKLGMLADVDNAEAIHTILVDYPDVPVVFDPVLASGSGQPLSEAAMLEAMTTLLLPQTTILTPNSLEARALAPGADTLDACAQHLMDRGCEFVLITGTHETTPEVVNRLYGERREIERFTWERLPNSYHGSGCTLAASLAGLLAQGKEPYSAVYEAQQYTWESLKYGYRLGMGQQMPNRLFWRSDEGDDADG